MTILSLCHNILTTNGWVRATNLNNTHKVALLDSNDVLHYATIIPTHETNVNQKMCFFKGKNINLFISADSYLYCQVKNTIEWKNHKASQLVGKEFTIKKNSKGIHVKNQAIYRLYGDSGILKCSTYEDSVEKQKILIDHGYAVDREEIRKFNRSVGYLLIFSLQFTEIFEKEDFTILTDNPNTLEITNEKYKMICVERYGKMIWIPI
jgi:hypothetical protein